MKTYIESRYPGATVEWYVSVGSGLNFERPEFLRLIGDILAGKYKGGRVIASTFDRVCRFGIRLVEHLCSIGDCELEYVLGEDDGEKTGKRNVWWTMF